MIRDPAGRIVRQVPAESGKGLHRTAWDLRLPPPDPVSIEPPGELPYWVQPPTGLMVLPGRYTARLAIDRDGMLTETGGAQSFTVKELKASPEITSDRKALQDFQLKVAGLQRAVAGSSAAIGEIQNRIAHVRAALVLTPSAGEAERDVLQQLSTRLADLNVAIHGDSTIGGRNEPVPMSIASRAGSLYGTLVYSQSDVGGNFRDSYAVAAQEFTAALQSLRVVERDLTALEDALEIKGAPWTPGRIPEWSAD